MAKKKSKKINKNHIIAISVIAIILLFAILFVLSNSPGDIEESIDKVQSNLGQDQAEQLAIVANQDWLVDLQPYYSVEVVDTTLQEGMWTVSLKLWDERDVATPADKKGYILAYKVDDATGEVMKNPLRTDLN